MSEATETFDALWDYCTANGRFIPRQWDKFYKLLRNTRQLPSGGWEPSLPLIVHHKV